MKYAKSLAIIGSYGMVGSDLILYLKPYFKKIIGINRKNYNNYLEHRFNIVINADGNSNKIWANNNVFDDFNASTISVYKSIFDFPCQLYIYISSSDVYENHTSKKFTSESRVINPDNLSPYGFHKYLSECIVRNAAKNYIILRCPMILGTKLKKGPIYDILHDLRLFISSKSAFQMITTKEIAQIIYFLVSKNIAKEVFNIGGTDVVMLSRINKYIKKQVVFPRNGKTQKYETDVSKLHKIYHLKKSGEYLQDLINNYKKNYNPTAP